MIENTFISLNNVDKLPLKLKFLEIYKINPTVQTPQTYEEMKINQVKSRVIDVF